MELFKLKFKENERAIHNLVVIVPNDYTDEEIEAELDEEGEN